MATGAREVSWWRTRACQPVEEGAEETRSSGFQDQGVVMMSLLHHDDVMITLRLWRASYWLALRVSWIKLISNK